MQPLKKIRSILSKMLDDMEIEPSLLFSKNAINTLNYIFSVGDNYYYIFNATMDEIEFVSPEMQTMLGYHYSDYSISYLNKKIHPDDIAIYNDFEETASKFLSTLPKNKLQKYKVRYDFRLKKKDNTYIRVLHQAVNIEIGNNGEMIRVLGVHTDITHLKKDGKPVLSFIGLDGEPSYIDVKIKTKFAEANDLLTKREKEILFHLVNGKSSAEIASILFLSKNTIDTHRRNMIRKTGTKKNTELIAFAIRSGLI